VIFYMADRHELKPRFEDDPKTHAGIWAPVTEKVAGVTLQQLLNRLLVPRDLGFRIEDDQLVITTREEADRAHAGINQLKQKLPNLKDVKVGW